MIKLNKREKRMLQGLGGVAILIIAYFLVIMPIMSFRSSIQKKFESNMSRLNRLDTIYSEYQEVKDKITRYRGQLVNTQGTTTLIEENAKALNILKNKVYTRDMPSNLQDKYKKISTDVKFEGIDIKSALDFIYKMENSGRLIRVSYLRINQALKGRNMYDVTIKFDTLASQ